MASDGWTKIDAPAGPYYSDGVERTPGCSAGPRLVPTPIGPIPVPADPAYSFFIRHGDPDKLAIVFDGGGACWDPNTCVGTALAGASVYSLEADETVESLSNLAGLGDNGDPENPVAGYTQVFIPYCTADLHTGDNTETYSLNLPDGSVLPWQINHRGADNVDFVLDWVQDYYRDVVGRAPRDVFVTGLSAGGYAALYHTPDIAGRLPWSTKIRVLVDAANGVITEDFQQRALSPDGVWGVWENISPLLRGAFSSGPDELIIETFKSLGSAYPRARFGQYTTAFDLTQIGFYNLARNTDSPELWLDPAQIAIATFEWTLKARTFQILTAFQVWNYRFYLAQGDDHTVLASDKFYEEDSARGVRLADWLDDMINRFWSFGGDWRNVSCTPDCLP
jgi:hypothetical protein